MSEPHEVEPRTATAADYGLVGLVGGGVGTALLAMVTLGLSAYLGRVPTFLAVLLSVALAVTVTSAVTLVVVRRRAD